MNLEKFKIKKRARFQSALKAVYDTPDGRIFFETFLEHCNVTKPKFAQDPMEINWNESRRHLAMSYLKLLAQDDLEAVVRQFEDSLRKNEEIDNE